MRSVLFLISCFALSSLSANMRNGFTLQADVAQYKGSDYRNVVHVARNISLEEAFDIAESNPDIDYFVYTTGYMMVLEIPPGVAFDPSQDSFGLVKEVAFRYDSGADGEGYCRIFTHGDTVFFKKEGIWLGTAPGLADTYVKE